MDNAQLQEKVFDSSGNNGWHKGETQDKLIRIKKTGDVLNETINHREGLNILDVGVGEGEIIQSANGSQNLFGIDIAAGKIGKLKNIEVKKCNFESEKFPFEDNSIDIVLCNEVIEHVLNSDHLLNEINRVLKKDGTFILSFPNVNQPASWLMGMLLDYPPKYCSRYKSVHVRDWTHKLIKKVIKNYNFTYQKSVGTFVWPLTGTAFMGNLCPRLCDDVIVVSSKNGQSVLDERPVVWDTNEI